MNRTATLGLLAFTIVASAACAMMGAVALSRPPSAGKAGEAPAAARKPETPAPREIPDGFTPEILAKHPFWRVKMTAGKVEGMVALIRKQQGYAYILIDDRGQTDIHDDSSGVIRTTLREDRLFGMLFLSNSKPANFSKRWIYFDMHDYPTRPSRESVLASLKMKLDIKDYHSKP